MNDSAKAKEKTLRVLLNELEAIRSGRLKAIEQIAEALMRFDGTHTVIGPVAEQEAEDNYISQFNRELSYARRDNDILFDIALKINERF